VFSAYVEAFALTLAVEVPLYLLGLVRVLKLPPARAAALAVGVNVATHPLVWWSLALLPGGVPVPLFLAVEAAVCLVEGLLLVWWTGCRSGTDVALLIAVAAGANAASTLAGLLLL
jgi:hypothetical protein